MRASSILFLVSCGGITTSGSDGGPNGDSGPSPPALVCTAGSCSSLQVMKTAFLGDTSRTSSNPSTTAWKDFGEDIDGKCSDNKSTDVCTRAAGAPSSVQQDGNRCRDNSFGANILPIIQSAGSIPNPSQQFTASVAAGKAHSLFFRLGIDSGAANLELDVAAPLGKPALFDGADAWPTSAFSTSSLGGMLTDFKPVIAGNTLSSGRSAQRFLLLVHIGLGQALPIPIDRLQIRMDLQTNTLQGSNGVISGVIPTETFIAMFKEAAGGISKALCGAAFDGIAQQIRQCSDILSDGTNRPGVPCDAISFGMGFDPAIDQVAAPVSETPVTQTCP